MWESFLTPLTMVPHPATDTEFQAHGKGSVNVGWMDRWTYE